MGSYTSPIPADERTTEPVQAKCDGLAGVRISVIASPSTITRNPTKLVAASSTLSASPPVGISSRNSPGRLIFGHQWSIWAGTKFAVSDQISATTAVVDDCPGNAIEDMRPQESNHGGDTKRDTIKVNISGRESDSNVALVPHTHDHPHRGCLICPSVTSSLPISSTIFQQAEPYEVGTELFFPLLFCEYKRKNYENVATAFRQAQMDCISGVESLRALGITDFPVYGLVTTGSRGSIMMAWHSTKSPCPPDTPETVCAVQFLQLILSDNNDWNNRT